MSSGAGAFAGVLCGFSPTAFWKKCSTDFFFGSSAASVLALAVAEITSPLALDSEVTAVLA